MMPLEPPSGLHGHCRANFQESFDLCTYCKPFKHKPSGWQETKLLMIGARGPCEPSPLIFNTSLIMRKSFFFRESVSVNSGEATVKRFIILGIILTLGLAPAIALATNNDPFRGGREAVKPQMSVGTVGQSTGAMTYTYPLTIPPGRNGVSPNSSFTYSSADKGQDSVFGYGWSMNLPYIERINKIGTDNLYDQDKDHSFFLSSLSGELLPAVNSTPVGGAFLATSLSSVAFSELYSPFFAVDYSSTTPTDATSSLPTPPAIEDPTPLPPALPIEEVAPTTPARSPNSTPLPSIFVYHPNQEEEFQALHEQATIEASTPRMGYKQIPVTKAGSVEEILGERTENTKVFRTENNGGEARTYQIFSDPVHYFNSKTAQFEDIYSSITEVGDKFLMEDAPYHVQMGRSETAALLQFSNGGQVLSIDIAPNALKQFLSQATETDPTLPPVDTFFEMVSSTSSVFPDLVSSTPSTLLDPTSTGALFLTPSTTPTEDVASSESLNSSVANAPIQTNGTKGGGVRMDVRKSARGEDVSGFDSHRIVYPDLMGKGVDIEITTLDNRVTKDIVIGDSASLGDISGKENVEFSFDVTSNEEIAVFMDDGRELSDGAPIISSSLVRIVSKDGVTTYIYPPQAHDSAKISIPIDIVYTKTATGFRMTKRVPTSFLKTAIYPVRTDATLSYTTPVGDGTAYNTGATWSTTHDSQATSPNGGSVPDGWYVSLENDKTGASEYRIHRGFLPFNTSALPDTAQIATATLHVWPADRSLHGDAYDYLAIVGPTTQATTTWLYTSDFNKDGATTSSTLLSDTKATSTVYWPANATNTFKFPLNATGLGAISKTGYTYLGIREGHDIDNVSPPSQATRYWSITSSENASGEGHPYLEVTVSGVLPSSLRVENLTNPSNIATVTPAFSAVFNGIISTDTTQYFRLQVSTSTSFASLVIDSGKASLSTSTQSGSRTPNFYATTSLSVNGTKYYWRVKFWDQSNTEGTWSAGDDYFIMQVGGAYMAKVDDGSFMRYTLGTDGTWIAYDKRGWKYTFGATSNARVNNTTTPSEIYRWMLEQVTDPNGNRILYSYTKDGGQVYPDYIDYTDRQGGSLYDIDFVQSQRGSGLSSATSSIYGFPVWSQYIITDVVVKSNNKIVHRFTPSYTTGDNGSRPLLSSIKETGYKDSDETGALALATTTFSYQRSTTAWSEITDANAWQVNFNFSDVSNNDLGYRILDVNGDALPDVVKSDGTAQEIRFNTGTKWDTASSSWTVPLSFSLSNLDAGVRTADVNGDGLVDLVSASTSRRVYLNNGTSTWVASSTWVFPESFIDTNNKDLGVQLADVNGDGLADILRSHYSTSTGTTSKVYINTGTGWSYDSGWVIPELFIDEIVGDQVDPGTRLYDYSADGLLDIVRSSSVSPGIVRAYINTGRGWALDASAPNFTAFSNGGGVSDADQGVRFVDVNGDGHGDQIQALGTNPKSIYLRGFGSPTVIAGTFPESFRDTGGHEFGVRLEDINGDGNMDVLRGYYDGTSNIRKVYLKNGDVPDLLKEVMNSKGGKTTVAYQSSTRYFDGGVLANPKMPFVAQTAKSITTDTGAFFGSNAHRVIATTTYDYRGGSYYAGDLFGRQFAGYGNVLETKPSGFTTKTYFHQGNSTDTSSGEFGDHIAKAGKPYRMEVLDSASTSANLFARTITKWARADYADGRNFVKPLRTLTQTFDGDSTHRDVAEELTYDDTKGDLTQRISWGEVSGNSDGTFTDTGSDKMTTDFSYAASSTNSAVSLLSRELVSDQSSNTVRDTKLYYDNLSLGSVGIGNQTKEERLISGSTYASTTKSYNSYGLPTLLTGERGGTTTIVYDAYTMFPATTTNAFGQSDRYAYDYSSGKVTSHWNPHGYEFRTDYDNLDRPTKEWQPDLTTPSTLVLAKESIYSDDLGIVTQTSTTTGSVLVAENFNSYSDGNINGANAGSGWNDAWSVQCPFWQNCASSQIAVEGTTVSEGAKAVGLTAGAVEPLLARHFNILTSGVAHVAMRKEQSSNDGVMFMLTEGTTSEDFGGNRVCSVYFLGGNIIYEGTTTATIQGYSPATWYDIYIQFDASTKQCRYKVGSGSWTSWIGFLTTETGITGASFNYIQAAGGDVMGYWDDFSISSLTAGTTTETFPTTATYVRQKVYLNGATSSEQITYIDGLGRAVKSIQEAEPHNGWVVSDTLYNKDGQTATTTLPYFSATSSYASPTTTNYLLTAYTYDPLGRAKTISDILGTTTSTYRDWFTRVSDPLGITKDALKDAYGNLVAIGEKLGSSGYATTTYVWNLNQKLTKITDASGNIRNFTYDNLGRSLLSEDLHASGDTTYGTTTRSYDVAGNVTQILNPRGQTVNYIYDVLNRPTSEDFTGQSGTEVQYYYDTCTNGKGKLCSVRKQSEATTTYLYNPLGLASAEGKTIGLGSTQSTATTSFTYFYNGKEDRIVYPDSAQVYYLYDSAGLLDKVLSKESGGATTSVVTRMAYTPLGQIEAQDYANGVNSTSTYEKTQKYRLTNKYSKNSAVLQDLRYTYDAVGNITSLADVASSSAQKTVLYGYDSLYRLTSASTTAVATGTSGYFQTFTYDALGNMLLGSSGSYTYGQTGYANPDAVTQIIATTTVAGGSGGTSTATPAFVQSKKDNDMSAVTLNSSVATGSLIVVGITAWNQSIPSNTVTDNKGNTYTRIVETINTNSTDHAALFYAKNVNGGSSFTVTSGITSRTMSVHEYSGVSTSSPLDKVASSTGLSTAPNSGNVTTTLANELYVGLSWSGGNGDAWTAGQGYTLRETETNNATFERHATEDRVISTATTTSAKFSVPTSEDWIAILATFKPLVTSGGTTSTTTVTATTTYTYDKSGNLLSYGSVSMGWDYNNRLASTTLSTSTVTYLYDHTGGRVQMKDSTTTQYWGRFYQQTPGGYTKTKQIYAGGQLIATVEKKGSASVIPYYVLTDHLGGSNILTNASGTATQTLEYFPFGDPRVNSKNTSFNEPRQYIGETYDTQTQLNYLNARYYDSRRGQFTGQDPIVTFVPDVKILSNPQALNFYGYSSNNPINKSDPSGLYNVSSGLVEKGDTTASIALQLNIAYGVKYGINFTKEDLSTYNGGKNPIVGSNYGFSINLNSTGAVMGVGGGSVTKRTDITSSLMETMRANANDSCAQSLACFINNVRTDGRWDLKDVPNGAYNSATHPEGFMFRGQYIPPDAPGNMNYGYVGDAGWWSTPAMLLGGAALYQNYSDIKNGMPTTFLKDNSGDPAYINWGIMLHRSDLQGPYK